MWSDFFQIMPLPADQLLGTYDAKLVALSYMTAVFASYIALDITGRLRDVSNTFVSGMLWLCGGAIAMGAGIWSMHFIGMLAFSIPGMTMQYDVRLTALSMLVAVLASGFALYLLRQQVVNWPRLMIGGVILGLAIASMHYIGMEAMKLDMHIHYISSLFWLSIIIAVVASEAALWLALKSNSVVQRLRVRLKVISAFIMGAAICGMHYVGMFAAVFTPNHDHQHHMSSVNLDVLALTIAGVTFVILGIAFFVSMYKEAMNQKTISIARETGKSEVATSVLHNVGNVLNSIVISSERIHEELSKSRLNDLSKLNELFKEHKENIGEFIQNDPRGKQIPAFINELAVYWLDQQSKMIAESEKLNKHIKHVKDIVALQQQLGKSATFEQLTSLDELLDEAILMVTSSKNPVSIDIQRSYSKLKPIYVDRLKLLQVIINLLQNARDALLKSGNESKKIIISTGTNDEQTCFIAVKDNGIGVPRENLTRIFSYGFTTRSDGHGYGLHASATSIGEMGGSIRVDSEGEGTGAEFTIELPYQLIEPKQDRKKQRAELV